MPRAQREGLILVRKRCVTLIERGIHISACSSCSAAGEREVGWGRGADEELFSREEGKREEGGWD